MHGKKFLYEYDPTGILAANRIPDEPHTITPVNGSRYYVLMPRFAPFFRQNLRVYHAGSSRPLDEGVHYDLGFHYKAASLETQQPVYGCIVITDTTLAGVFKVTYQTLGGEFVLDDVEIDTILANIKNDPRTVKFDDIIGRPITFPPSDHLHHSDDLVGMEDVEKAILACADSASENLSKALLSLLEHLKDHNNPHHVTLQQLGLDELGSLAEATDSEIEAGTDASHYVSARGLEYFRKTKVAALLKTHTDRTDNPHGVTKDQVGLGAVENYRPATLQEAMEGKLNNRYLTPYLANEMIADKIAEALVKWAGENGVSKESIGLGNVPNYGMATEEEALAGVLNERLMSPLLVSKVIANAIATAMRSHLDDPNPHNITKRTIGLENVENFGVATQGEIESGVATNKLTTVAQVKAMIDLFGGSGEDSQGLINHLADFNNPHKVNKEQVGLPNVPNWRASELGDIVLNSLVDNAFMSPTMTAKMIALYLNGSDMADQTARDAISSHTENRMNPHGVNKDQVGLGQVDNFATAADSDYSPTGNNKFATAGGVDRYVTQKLSTIGSDTVSVLHYHGIGGVNDLLLTVREFEPGVWLSEAQSRVFVTDTKTGSFTEFDDTTCGWGVGKQGIVLEELSLGQSDITGGLVCCYKPLPNYANTIEIKPVDVTGNFVMLVSVGPLVLGNGETNSHRDISYVAVTTTMDLLEGYVVNAEYVFNNKLIGSFKVKVPAEYHTTLLNSKPWVMEWKAVVGDVTARLGFKLSISPDQTVESSDLTNVDGFMMTPDIDIKPDSVHQLKDVYANLVSGFGSVFKDNGVTPPPFMYFTTVCPDITTPFYDIIRDKYYNIGRGGVVSVTEPIEDDPLVPTRGSVLTNPYLQAYWSWSDTDLRFINLQGTMPSAHFVQEHQIVEGMNLIGYPYSNMWRPLDNNNIVGFKHSTGTAGVDVAGKSDIEIITTANGPITNVICFKPTNDVIRMILQPKVKTVNVLPRENKTEVSGPLPLTSAPAIRAVAIESIGTNATPGSVAVGVVLGAVIGQQSDKSNIPTVSAMLVLSGIGPTVTLTLEITKVSGFSTRLIQVPLKEFDGTLSVDANLNLTYYTENNVTRYVVTAGGDGFTGTGKLEFDDNDIVKWVLVSPENSKYVGLVQSVLRSDTVGSLALNMMVGVGTTGLYHITTMGAIDGSFSDTLVTPIVNVVTGEVLAGTTKWRERWFTLYSPIDTHYPGWSLIGRRPNTTYRLNGYVIGMTPAQKRTVTITRALDGSLMYE